MNRALITLLSVMAGVVILLGTTTFMNAVTAWFLGFVFSVVAVVLAFRFRGKTRSQT
jgi:hypothetical protein